MPHAGGVGPAMGTIQALAGNRAASAVVQRLEEDGKAAAGKAKKSRSGLNIREKIADALERANKQFDRLDTFVLRGMNPIDAGLATQAAKTSDAPLGDNVHEASGGAAGEMAATDGLTAVNGVLDARKAYKESKENPSGPASHAARKKYPSKALDAIQSMTTFVSDNLSVAKNLLHSDAVAAATTAEAGGGVLSTVAGAKSVRATRRAGVTTRKYRAIKKVDVGTPVGDEELAELREAELAGHRALGEAYLVLERSYDEGEGTFAQRLDTALDQVGDALKGIDKAAGGLKLAEDTNALNTSKNYVLGKQRNKVLKLGVGALGDGVRSAAAGVTIAAAATGTLASNPVGWALAATAAGLLLSVTAYKTGRAGMKRYEGARHPERWAPSVEEGGEAPAEPASQQEALKEALKFWKKAKHGERQAMARTLYGLAAGPDVPAGKGTSPKLRASARELLVVLKAGPQKMRMATDEWEKSLNDPEQTEKWLKEIENQLSSG
ncbi:hypothetical protein [Streptomyces montanisoli]|uniref:Uncharacterized protein n=1 Tax=Streptomyces montanisoli TaxID=2798581 RepID=A0A940MCB5_9ACTN|nr:hypothetical protein [Streptomyces montanisoli]MBP0457385.1 hypothetical protein [Streptomyces montanisoli]